MITRSLAVAVAASLVLGAAPAHAQTSRPPAAPATRSRAASRPARCATTRPPSRWCCAAASSRPCRARCSRSRPCAAGRPRRRSAARSGAAGASSSSFKVGNPGTVRLVVKHAASRRQAAFRAKRPPHHRRPTGSAGAGERGLKVLLLQRALVKARASPSPSPATTTTAPPAPCSPSARPTSWAATATPSPRVRDAGARPGRLQAALPQGGQARGVRLVAPGAGAGQRRPSPTATYHTSSGTPATPTVFGTYRFYRKTPGTNAKGMVHSSLLHRRLRDPRLRVGADLPGQPRLPARADPQRSPDLRAGSTSATGSSSTARRRAASAA